MDDDYERDFETEMDAMVPGLLPTAYRKALDALDEEMLPVILLNWNEDFTECVGVEWHLFNIEPDGPGYDDSDLIRERFSGGVAIAIRYHDTVHEGECE